MNSAVASRGNSRAISAPVLEAIKLTDIELSEVKEYNMLDLGVSMTVETIDSIIPSYAGDDYDDAESIDDGAGRKIATSTLEGL